MSRPSERQQMNEAANKIGKLLENIRRAKEGRAIREQLKKLPYVCRAGFFKMRMLKEKSNLLRNEANQLFKI